MLSQDLPGWEAQKLLSPVGDGGYRIIPEDHKKAAVLLLIHFKENKPHVVFIKRSSNYPQDKHAGQISFPGGALDKEDISLQHCAVRETFEEIGISETSYEIVGSLSSLYVYVSKFLMFPFVAISKENLNFDKEDEEVERIISWPLELFLDSDTRKVKDIHIRNSIIKNVPYFSFSDDVLWGATAMVMSEFLEVLKSKL